MVTYEHEYLLELVRNNPTLVTDLMTGVDVPVPAFDEATLGTCDLTDRRPTEYRADMVVIFRLKGKPVHAIVLEVQRQPDQGKKWSWPVYISTLRAIRKCPVTLLVFCEDRTTAVECARAIDMGHPGWILKPIVVDPSKVPKVTDLQQAIDNPELTALSAIVYGRPDTPEGVEVIRTFFDAAALRPPEQASYAELVHVLLPKFDFAQFSKELGMAASIRDAMVHPFVRDCVAFGIIEGKAEGEAEATLRVLRGRGISVSAEAEERIRSCTDLDILATWIDRALKVHTVDELFD